jgi:histidine phosphotransferase ChpT
MTDQAPDIFAADEALLLTQLLCTRLCHDLAGPVGAVAAGVELAGSDPSQMDEETLGLIGSSSAAASRKLKFLRGALGVPASASSVGGLKPIVEGYLESTAGRGGPPAMTWLSSDDAKILADALGAAAAPLVLNMCLLVVEGLPVCQRIDFIVERQPTFRFVVAGHGEAQRTAAWRPDILDAVSPTPAVALSVKTIQPHLAKRLSQGARGRLSLEAQSPILRAVFEK